MLYASSEGTAGVLGNTLAEAIQVMIAIPAWYDVAGQAPVPDAMRAAFEPSEAVLKDESEPAIDAHRAEISTLLGLGLLSAEDALVRLRDSLAPDHGLIGAGVHDPLCQAAFRARGARKAAWAVRRNR
ncbi:hypothetical protein [Kibdelosporangium phytohabitans]|uniref:Uncharacterized protein n=1 Tax=Kibdelosporangium phytohabitans TaxID=860235 RepID=A0A0N9I3C8_9PSEU|nr:hypothetical protein [Kibdelosporangium phytohabitans]ALG09265.1 hypothetical protein AOZ06_22235 [Kibdelosporangium phytohabitans]MBE1469490.1 hypothetical protein [Kibdelosporangium phytohabitans]